MKSIRLLLLAALLCAFGSPTLAADETFEGSMVCAKCYLKKPDAKECQDVLLVSSSDGAKGAKKEYYITKNDVSKKAGEACMTEVQAKVTGTVSEKDGKTWLTPSRIEKQ